MTRGSGRELERERIARALGASETIKLDSGPSRGPLDLVGLQAEATARLRSSGGRPTDPAWDITRQVPFSRERWRQLEVLAAEIGTSSRRVSPAQLAAMLVERALDEALAQRHVGNG